MSKLDRHYGTFTNGRLKAASLNQAVRQFPEGTPLEFTVRKAVDRRSNPQNRYYWGCVVAAIKAGLKEGGMDVTTEQTHEVLKFRFLKRDVPVGSDGEFVTVVESTSALDVMVRTCSGGPWTLRCFTRPSRCPTCISSRWAR